MIGIIYVVIVILFIAYSMWTLNNAREFSSNGTKMLFLIIGTIIISLVTLILFSLSRLGIPYPKLEMVGVVRRIILLVFVPINGLIILPQIANVVGKVKKDKITQDEFQRKAIIMFVIVIAIVIIECIYFKNIQTGIINLYNMKV